MTPTMVDSTNYADASYRSEDAQKKVSQHQVRETAFPSLGPFLMPLAVARPDPAGLMRVSLSFDLSWNTSVQTMQMPEKSKNPINLCDENRRKQPSTKNRRRHQSASGKPIAARCHRTPAAMRYDFGL